MWRYNLGAGETLHRRISEVALVESTATIPGTLVEHTNGRPSHGSVASASTGLAFERSSFEVLAVERNGDDPRSVWMTKESVRARAVVRKKSPLSVKRPDDLGGRTDRKAGLRVKW